MGKKVGKHHQIHRLTSPNANKEIFLLVFTAYALSEKKDRKMKYNLNRFPPSVPSAAF